MSTLYSHFFKTVLVLIIYLFGFCFCAYAGECFITANGLLFGEYKGTAIAPPVYGDAAVFVSCNDNEVYEFCVSTRERFPQRLRNKNNGLNYSLYKSVARTVPIAPNECFPLLGGVAGTNPIVASCPSSNPCKLAMYGKIDASQIVGNKGVYDDGFRILLNVTGKELKQYLHVRSQVSVNR